MINRNYRRQKIYTILISLLLIASVSGPGAQAAGTNYSKADVVASELVTTVATANGVKIYLSTFRPNMDLFINMILHVNASLSSTSKNIVAFNNVNSVLQMELKFPTLLNTADREKAITTFTDSSGITRVQIFPMPLDFPKLGLLGDKSISGNLSYLMTPTTAVGSYAIATQGLKIAFFLKSARFIVGFRELDDAPLGAFASGTARYGYLEQVALNNQSLSPGIWSLLDSNFEKVGRIASVGISGTNWLPDGHGMTTAPDGNAVVIIPVTRNVNSSWLATPYPKSVLDCTIAEVLNGKPVHSFSLWDWADSHRSESKALMDSGLRDPDPYQPNGPLDICHANSLEFNAQRGEYLVSVRSLSVVFILDKSLSTVKLVLSAPGAMQHFARFNGSSSITALGNYSNEKFSRFMNWTLVSGSWVLNETMLPIHVVYCGNAQFFDKTHIWVGGGCQAFAKNVLGVLYDVSGSKPVEKSRLTASAMGFSYRVDLYKP
jgi:hypothetical protein